MNEDQGLFERAKRFDPDALGALHNRFYGPVYRYVRFKVGEPHISEDLASEVFARVLEALKRGRGWHNTPNAWIFGIARNVVADHYRRGQGNNRPEAALDELLSAPAEDDPAHTVLQAEQCEELVQAISLLTDEQRDVILLRFIEEQSIKDAAEAMNKSPGAVKSLQYRALCALSQIMRHNPGAIPSDKTI